MSRLLASMLLAGLLYGQITQKDPLERSTPQSSVFHFLEACHSRDYNRASYYLDLKRLNPSDRAKNAPDLARQLEDVLDDTPFDIATLSRDPDGDQTDGLGPGQERLDTFLVDGQALTLYLERQGLKNGLQVWVVAADSVELIPQAHKLVAETAFEKRLPQRLVTFEFLDTPVWRWIALVLMAFALWILAGLVSRAVVAVTRRVIDLTAFVDPVRALLSAAAFRAAIELAPPSALPRLFVERAIGLIFSLALAWMAAVTVDLLAARWHSRLDPRVQAVSFSVLPLGRQVLKLSLFLIAVLTVVSAWGYNTSTILAGLGVGGLAVALAAQKTIENLFGGISVIGDRPVLVGDVCRFGDRVGTVMNIGLRSTRIRTPERTIICVPNGQFSSMSLENISSRDKVWFHPKLSLRRDTTADQLEKVVAGVNKILAENPKFELGTIPVRFIEVAAYSLDVEVNAYVKTSNFDEFLGIQQQMLIKILHVVEESGTALAVPLQETAESPRH
jgi:MscS family membrane protein